MKAHKPTGSNAGSSSTSAGHAPGKRTRSQERYSAPVMRKAVGRSSVNPSSAFAKATEGASAEVPYRGDMERAFGQDFSTVVAFTGKSEPLDAIGASAAATNEKLAFADATPSRELVAHELTHVVQERRHGNNPRTPDLKSSVSSPNSAAEREADSVAERVAAGEPAGPIEAAPGGAIQRFSPTGHEDATVAGLRGHFSPDEIAATYAANWERDFSQGNKEIANAAIAWRAVKLSAAKNGGNPSKSTAEHFKAAVWKVVDLDAWNPLSNDSLDESLGGYKYWEHMDQPSAVFSDPAEDADERWEGVSNGVAGYINDSKAHIKDQMVAAIDVYRMAKNKGGVGGSIDNWKGAEKPKGYVAPATSETKTHVHTRLPAGWDPSNVDSRDPIREQTRNKAKAAEIKSGHAYSHPAHDPALWRLVGQHLGRAMHAFEDFWAHSNWLDLAQMLKKAMKEDGATTGKLYNWQLKTGTFGLAAKCHALGHKIYAMASAFEKDFPLLLKVYGRTKGSTKISHSKRRPWYYIIDSDSDDAFDPLLTNSLTPAGEIFDVVRATNVVEELVQSGDYSMADFLCNKQWLAALRNKGKILIEEGNQESGGDSHGTIAKDQHEPGKDFEGAARLAAVANRMVFGPLRAIMDEKDVDKALTATQKQLELVDAMLQSPSSSHPLWNLIMPRPSPKGDFFRVRPSADSDLG